MASSAVKITRNLKAPEKPGFYRRIICLTGKNKGLCYYIQGKRVVLGRGKDCDVQVLDVKASREHLEIVAVGRGLVLTDLKSQNGVVVNDLKVSQHELKDGDKIIIGTTVLKYGEIEVKNELVEVDEEDDEDEEEEELEEVEKSKSKKKPNRRVLIYGIVALLAAFFLLPEEDTKGPKKAKKTNNQVSADLTKNFIKKKETDEDKELQDTIETYIHRGQREYREGNYFRAMEEFRRALILSPEHGRASFYMEKAKQRLDEKIKKTFISARQETEALKYDAAVVSYCSVVKLLQDYREEDERYKQAEEQIRVLERKMGLLEGEIKCFETK
ncbi:FHA domain-containing protein [Halobacteriovorax sp. GB3]|uniref:FHA domain-containing protein n=1 Tax=Halobacteriovorax sp. GB3 TaxID=2719615 RepID=UPI00235F05B2|nr:FHA domain-containing protein [Halobacteriovorax sp. GB3]MDD0854450.1 FHA domain-containing protein [Halobacteriovorax sp. GB3]